MSTSAFLEVFPQKKKSLGSNSFPLRFSATKSGQVVYYPDDDQGSGEHGIVSSLPEGLGQASGRVDVPDDAKIEAAAAFAGTLRSRPGSLDALGSVLSREGKFNFSEGL